MMQSEAEVLDMYSSTNQVDALCTEPLQTGRETPANTDHSLRPDVIIRSFTQPKSHDSTRLNGQTRHSGLWARRIEGAALALFSSALAPAVVMTTIWHEARLAPMVFAFTLIIALSHAVAIGLPLFVVCLWRKWMDFGSCVFLGSLIGAVPAAILTYPVRHPAFHANAWIGSLPIVASEMIRSATRGAYIEPLIYCGLLGALGGLVFWTVLRFTGAFGGYRD
jgi:hypothetical protein